MLFRSTSMPLERFPPAERAVVLSLLKPYLGPLFQGESSEQLNHAMRSFRAERIKIFETLERENPALSGREIAPPSSG